MAKHDGCRSQAYLWGDDPVLGAATLALSTLEEGKTKVLGHMQLFDEQTNSDTGISLAVKLTLLPIEEAWNQ